MTQLALILLQLSSQQLSCASTQNKWPQKWLHPWVSLLILQQPIRARLLWWLLQLSFKIRRPLWSCYPAAMTSLFGYLFNTVCRFFFPFSRFFCFSSPDTYKKKRWNKKNYVHNYKSAIKTNRLRFKIEMYVYFFSKLIFIKKYKAEIYNNELKQTLRITIELYVKISLSNDLRRKKETEKPTLE